MIRFIPLAGNPARKISGQAIHVMIELLNL